MYGLRDCDEIDNLLNIQLWASETFLKKHGLGTTRWILKQGLNAIEHFSGVKIRKEIFKESKTFSKRVIIFDDLERCSIPINDVLGYINKMVEHDKQKVIIVANEHELGKYQGIKNLDSRIALVLNDRVILSEENMPSSDFLNRNLRNNAKDNTPRKYTPKDLLYLSKQLSFEDESYRQIREKAIGLTIKFEPTLTDLFDEVLAENSKRNSSKNKILDCKSDILNLFISIVYRKENAINNTSITDYKNVFLGETFFGMKVLKCGKSYQLFSRQMKIKPTCLI